MDKGTVGRGIPRWFDTDAAGVSQKAMVAAGLSLGAFLFALESERLPALAYVEDANTMPVLTTVLSLAVLAVCVIRLCRRPMCRPAPLAWPVLAALSCSLGLLGRYLQGPLPDTLQALSWVLYSVSTPMLVYFWVQRAVPFGRAFVTRSFGMGAIVLGCLSMLTMAFEHTVALGLVVAFPFVGVALLPLIGAGGGVSATVGCDASGCWNALRAVADGGVRGDGPAGARRSGAVRVLARSALKLVPFLCYAVVFGNVHFSWLGLQDGGTVNMWVQIGASTGSIVCGFAALALARLHWGHALENIMGLLLTAFALVALWLSTFLTSGDVFAYLVLLNIAQKLTFLLMLLFGFPFSRNGCECASLWALAYFSFYSGTCVSYMVGTYAEGALNVVAAVALVMVFVADIADIILLYGNESLRPAVGGVAMGPVASAAVGLTGRTDGKADVTEMPAAAALDSGRRAEASVHKEHTALPEFDALSYTCHLIASRYGLTRREEEILGLLMRGRTAARISEALCITVATARTHQRNIYAKLGVHNQQDILDLFDRYRIDEGSETPDTTGSTR